MAKIRLEDYDEDSEETRFEKFSRTKKTKMKSRTKEGDKSKIKKPTGVMKLKKRNVKKEKEKD